MGSLQKLLPSLEEHTALHSLLRDILTDFWEWVRSCCNDNALNGAIDLMSWDSLHDDIAACVRDSQQTRPVVRAVVVLLELCGFQRTVLVRVPFTVRPSPLRVSDEVKLSQLECRLEPCPQQAVATQSQPAEQEHCQTVDGSALSASCETIGLLCRGQLRADRNFGGVHC